MRKMVVVTNSMYKYDDGKRELSYNFKFKNEEFANLFMNAMENKFEDYGYDFRFWRCPEIDEKGIYFDGFSVPFENGEMKNIKDDIRDIFEAVKYDLGVK